MGKVEVKVIKVENPQRRNVMLWIKEMFMLEILKGLSLTFRRMLTKRITMYYPEEKWVPAENFRGQTSLVRLPQTPDKDLCVGCCLCVRVCPSQCIEIISSRGPNNVKLIDDYIIDTSRCIYCGNCVEVCPVSALVSSDLYELSVQDRKNLIKHKADLLRDGMDYKKRFAELKAKNKEMLVVKADELKF